MNTIRVEEVGDSVTVPVPKFAPRRLVRNGTIQSILALHQTPGYDAVTRYEQQVLLDGGEDETGVRPESAVRLVGYFTPHQTDGPARGMALQLHGWEGCSHSIYGLLVGTQMIEAGFDLLRLDFRDHGQSHALNPGLFYATLIGEVRNALSQAATWAESLPIVLIGASLGGNFALRLALSQPENPIPGLERVIAINPVLDPVRSIRLLDRQPIFRHFFRRRWMRSLRKKQAHFPDRYDFTPVETISSIQAMTDWLMRRYGPFDDGDSYLHSYAIAQDAFASLDVPTTILTSADDPIIPADDFYRLDPHPLLDVHVMPSGGHVGYVDVLPLSRRLPELVLPILGDLL